MGQEDKVKDPEQVEPEAEQPVEEPGLASVDNRNNEDDAEKSKDDRGCQTDISVYPHLARGDVRAGSHCEIQIQTSLTCAPNESFTTVKEKLEDVLTHEGTNIRASTVAGEPEAEQKTDEPETEQAAGEPVPEEVVNESEAAGEQVAGEAESEIKADGITESEEMNVTSVAPLGVMDSPKICMVSLTNEADIQRRIDECSTDLEKQLILAMATAMKSLNSELVNLKTMYDTLMAADMKLPEAKSEESFNDKITEYDKYQFDLLSPDADEFPLAVFITDKIVSESKSDEFDLPARNVKDFDNTFYDDDRGIQAMLDTDLSACAGPLDKNIFTVGSKLPGADDRDKPKAMYDSNLRGGIVPPQLGMSKRVDFTLFIEDYVQKAMRDCDLLVKPPPGEPCPPDPNGPKAMYDCDLGRSTPFLKKKLMSESLNCTCFDQWDEDCICGCTNDDNEDDESFACNESELSIPVMHDYDLKGGLIKRIKKVKPKPPPKVIGGPMWDYELCHLQDDLLCICFERKESDCYCDCNPIPEEELDEEEQCFVNRPMYDFDLCEHKPPEDMRHCVGKRAMFDFDLCPEDKPDLHPRKEKTVIDPEPGEGMFDYELEGDMICRPPTPISRLRKYRGLRGMFDFDLKFVIDPDRTTEGKCCVCANALQPDCKCGCTIQDINQGVCKCIGDSIPRAMLDKDLGKKFQRPQPLNVDEDPCDPCIPGDRCLDEEEEEEEKSGNMRK